MVGCAADSYDRGVWIAVWLTVACRETCDGPGCAASWPAARVALHRVGDGTPERAAWTDRDDGFEGALADGSEWAIAAVAGRVAVGMPEADRVVRLDGLGGGAAAIGGSIDGEDGLGAAIAWVGEDLWSGAPGAGLEEGAVARFVGGAGPAVVTWAGGVGDRLGTVLRRCPDLDGDGEEEIVVGVPRFGGVTPDGTVVPALGGAVGRLPVDLTAGDVGYGVGVWVWGDEAGAGLGAAVSCDADLDGDGLVDLLVGAPFAGVNDVGAVVHLDPLGGDLAIATRRRIDGVAADGWLGRAVAASDVDDDGVPDVIAGEPGANDGSGLVAWFSGARWLAGDPPNRVVRSVALPGARHAGRELAVGDVDGDGRDEIVVGAPDAVIEDDTDRGLVGVWWAAVFKGGASPAVRIVGETAFARAGARPVLADLDGDGSAELLLPLRAPAPAP